MALPIAKYGLREALLLGIPLLVLSFLALVWNPPVTVLPFAALLFVLAFFRDPERRVPPERMALLAPADGRVAEVTEAKDSQYFEGRALKIGIFMSLFNVHVNRSPAGGEVLFVDHRKGKFLSALNPRASRENECCTIGLRGWNGTLIVVRQIAGVIARRIVCRASKGDRLEKGERFGMIKFGSRVEVIIPLEELFECRVKTGDKVKAGLTILGIWKENPE